MVLFSTIQEQYLEHLMLVVQCIRETKLIIKAKKLQTALNQINYLIELGQKVGCAGEGCILSLEAWDGYPGMPHFYKEKKLCAIV